MKKLLLMVLLVPVFGWADDPCDVPHVLRQIRPGEIWAIDGNDLSTFIWKSPTMPPTVAEINAGIANCPNQIILDSRNSAVNELLNGTSDRDKLERAIILSLIDALNISMQRDRDRATDVAAATSLADLKTRWAARSTLNDITVPQAKAAVQNKINSGNAD